jgi:hypothetical protein
VADYLATAFEPNNCSGAFNDSLAELTRDSGSITRLIMVHDLASASSSSSSGSKRKGNADSANEKPAKKPRAPGRSKGKSKEIAQGLCSWPDYLNAVSLYILMS